MAAVACEKYSNVWIAVDDIQCLCECPHAFHQADGVRIDALGIFRPVTDRERHRIPQPDQSSYFFEQSNHLWVELDHQLQLTLSVCRGSSRSDDIEKPTIDSEIASASYLRDPRIVQRLCVQLCSEGRAFHL